MGTYSELWKGELLYYQLFQLGIIILLLFILPFVQNNFIKFLVMVLYIVAFQYMILLRRTKKKALHEGNRIIAGYVYQNSDTFENVRFEFTGDFVEIPILVDIGVKDSDDFKDMYNFVVRKDTLERENKELNQKTFDELAKDAEQALIEAKEKNKLLSASESKKETDNEEDFDNIEDNEEDNEEKLQILKDAEEIDKDLDFEENLEEKDTEEESEEDVEEEVSYKAKVENPTIFKTRDDIERVNTKTKRKQR